MTHGGGRSASAGRPSRRFPRVGPFEGVCGPPGGRAASQPHRGDETRCRALVARLWRSAVLAPLLGPLSARPEGQCRQGLESNPDVRFLCGIKAGGQVRPRPNHAAPQRGSVQGLPGFRASPFAGITLGLLGSLRGSRYPKSPATSRFARGLRRGCDAKNAKTPRFYSIVRPANKSQELN